MSQPDLQPANDTDARPARTGLVVEIAGDAANADKLGRIRETVAALKRDATLPLLQSAVDAVKADDWRTAGELAIKALEIDEKSGVAWHVLGIAREKAGDFTASLSCYEAALKLVEDDTDVANDLGRLAYRTGQKELAGKLFGYVLSRRPGDPDGANNLACVLRDQLRFSEAIDLLKPVIAANPESPLLWNTLGSILTEQGDPETAQTFFDEVLRLDPAHARARYNRGNVRMAVGDVDAALKDVELALKLVTLEHERAMMNLARSTMLLASGRIAEGWDAYEARLDPFFTDLVHYAVEDAPRWRPQDDLAGKVLLVFGEQGLGDEIMFANMLRDAAAAVGPEGALLVAVEHRLVEIFRRALPGAHVGAHRTYTVQGRSVRAAELPEGAPVADYWTPMGALTRRFRTSVEAFPADPVYLPADPARVARWKAELAQLDGPTVGVLWKSLKIDSGRSRYFSPFDAWKPVLQTPGAAFVNLQYGDCSAELEVAAKAGLKLWTPPIDLKNDLDEVQALCAALDLVIGPPNATSNIAAAAGADVWMIAPPAAWTRLGAEGMPWYPTVRVFEPERLGRWSGVMKEVAAALSERVAARGG